MAYEKHFCDNYLLLKPKEASFTDIFGFLISSSSEKKVVEIPDGKDEHWKRDFERRWYVVVSIVVQKLLLAWGDELSQIGHSTEDWLNLIASNGGFLLLLSSYLRGNKLVRVERWSANYTSLLGNIDTRIELDDNIKPERKLKYYASLSMMAAKVSYENEAFARSVVNDHWKMNFLGLYNFWNDFQNLSSTQALIFKDRERDAELIMVAFRGTSPFDADAWRTDVDLSWYELEGVGKMHSGFMKALGLQRGKGWPKDIDQHSEERQFAYYAIRKLLKQELERNEKAKVVLTGHSLGAALAVMFVGVLGLHEETWVLDKLEGVYTFGQPRVGDEQFGKFMEEKMRVYDVRYWRYVYCNDMVPRVPYDDKTPLYKHFGSCLYFNSLYKGKIEAEEPNPNYFSPVWFMPKILNAVWELVRSFIIPFWKGSEYQEGWFLRILRVIGLVIPGLSAHCFQDYVNTTRIGSLSREPDLPIHDGKSTPSLQINESMLPEYQS